MIVERADPMVLFVDMLPGTVFGFDGTYCVKMEAPVEVKHIIREKVVYQTYGAFDIQQNRLKSIPAGAKGFIVRGSFVEVGQK